MTAILSAAEIAALMTQAEVSMDGDPLLAVIASHEALRAQADARFFADLDAEATAKCGACFEGVCEICIEQRGMAGDGQPCRCAHAGWYAEGLRRMTAERDAALAAITAYERAWAVLMTEAPPVRIKERQVRAMHQARGALFRLVGAKWRWTPGRARLKAPAPDA
jgi:hypothetical protein